MSDDLFGSDDDGDVRPSSPPPRVEPKPAEDLFGSDDDEQPTPSASNRKSKSTADDTDLFQDSDDDDNVAPSASKTSKRGKKKKFIKKRSLPEEPADESKKKKKKKTLSGGDGDDEPKKKKKRSHDDDEKKKQKKLKKLKKSSGGDGSNDQPDGSDSDAQPSSDDDDDEDNKLVPEDEENDDGESVGSDLEEEKKKSKKKSMSSAGGETRPKTKTLGDDPLSDMLKDTKRKKGAELTDEEKANLVDSVVYRMGKAMNQDFKDRKEGKPALNKLNLLPVVEQAVNTKFLQEVLVERGILKVLADWIEPSEETQALPPLQLRSSVYKMLTILPVGVPELKESEIGKKLFKLRKNPLETPANKIVLKDILENWSRLVFNRSSKQFEQTQVADEIRSSIIQQCGKLIGSGADQSAASFDLSQSQQSQQQASSRARAPVGNGFMFTIDLKDTNLTTGPRNAVRPAGENRSKLTKIMSEGSTAGKKAKVRAIDSNVSGKDIQV